MSKKQIEINIVIEKVELEWWPRLTLETKPVWLKLDFDKLKTEEDDEEEDYFDKVILFDNNL